ncbi:MAG: class I SAM-dependent methyltransferase [Desulfobacterales bacterium]|jgi:SAM-dependent methyltransferase
MRLNLVEFLVMNNPLRSMVQRAVEAPRLERAAGGRIHAGRALEIGCGQGAGVEIILSRFGAEKVDAFDLDPRAVKRARRRLAGVKGVGAIRVGDATRIDAPDEAYDSVFNFGAIHHIVDWRRAVSEVFRVLKPGGSFYAQEVFRDLITHPLWRRLLAHPQQDRFDFRQFEAALTGAGFEMIGTNRLGKGLGWFACRRKLFNDIAVW